MYSKKKDLMTETKLFIPVLIDLMTTIGKSSELTGKQKKEYVIKQMRRSLDLPQVYEDILALLIDTLIEVQDGKLIFNQKLKKTTKWCC